MLLVLDNKVELNYQLGHLITASQAALIVSIQWRFVVIVIEVPADIIGARDNEKEVELTRAEYQLEVATGGIIMRISQALTLAPVRSLSLPA